MGENDRESVLAGVASAGDDRSDRQDVTVVVRDHGTRADEVAHDERTTIET